MLVLGLLLIILFIIILVGVIEMVGYFEDLIWYDFNLLIKGLFYVIVLILILGCYEFGYFIVV